jgi:hypothetical protein
MPIYTKKSNGTWSTNAKKVFVKASDGLWKSAARLFAKTVNGWVLMWPGDGPAINQNDPINIRSGGYNGAVVESPQYINAVLYGHDNNGASVVGDQPISILTRKMKIATDDTGNTERKDLESTDIYNLTSNSEANVAEKRYYADNWWLFYQLTASNVWSPPPGTTLYSFPPIKIIRQVPTASVYTLAEDYSLLPYFATYTFDVTVSDLWYKAADLSRSYVAWWENTTASPGGTQLQKTYLDDIANYSTTRSNATYAEYDGSGTSYNSFDIYQSNGEPTPGKYIVAELVLINSYTDHYNAPQSYYRSSGTQAAFGAVSILDYEGNSALDRRDNLPVSASFAHVVNITGTNSSTVYRARYRIYNNQASTNTYYNPSTGASGSSGMWKTFSSTGGDDGSSYISSIVDTSSNSVTLTDYYSIDETLFPPVTYTDSIFGSQYPKWALEVEISALSGGVRTYAWPGLNYNSYNVSPASDLSISANPSGGGTPLTVTFSGTTTPFPNISGYRAYPVAYKINWGDGTGDSGWNYFSSSYNNSYSISHTYYTGGTYNATVTTMPDYTTNSVSVEAVSIPSPPSFLTATTNRGDGVYLEWQNVGANYYEIYWQSIQGGGPVNQSSYADFGQLNEITTNSYLDTTISAGGTRYYRVRARNSSTANGSYTSNWYPNYGSNGITGTRALITPNVPTGLSGSPVGNGANQKISLSWNSALNASYYELYYNGTGTTPDAGFAGDYGSDGSITGTSFTTPYDSYAASTTYYWWVRSVSSSGLKSAWSSRISVITNRQQFTVTWNANGGSVSPSSSTTDSNGYVTTPTPTRSGYSFNGWYDRPTGDYTYGPISGGISWLAPSTITMYARWSVALPGTPTSLSATTTRSDGVNLTFSGSNLATSYDIFWNTSQTATPSSSASPDFTGVTSPYLDTTISGGVTRWYWVRGRNADGVSAWYPATNGVTGTRTVSIPLPSTPTGLTATTNRTTDVYLSWNASSSATTYEIWWGGPPSDSSTPDFYPGSATSYFDNTISQGSSRTYYVRARNSTGASSWSSGATGTRASAPVVSAPTGLSINLSFSSGPSWSGSWSATGATSYSWTFYTATDSSGSGMTFRSSGSGTSMSYSGGTQVWGKVYVTATNSGGSTSGESGWV